MAFLLEPDDLSKRLGLEPLIEACVPVVRELVDRFDLRGRNLMSVGAGGGFEEIAFLKNGVRRAFLFDIDEHGQLQNILPQLHRPGNLNAPIAYVLDDFTKVQPQRSDLEPIDFLYFSSFTPDELRRSQIRDEYMAPNSLIAKCQQKLRASDPNWPDATSPIHEIITAAIDQYLVDGGIFVLQSYCGGISPTWNPGYVTQWQRTLAAHDVELLEAYCFVVAPGVTLWVGQKCKAPGAERDEKIKQTRSSLTNRPPLMTFHGRAELEDKTITRFFPA